MRSNRSIRVVPENASILIVLMGALGDVVRGMCLPGEIKRHWPDTTITWLVEPSWRTLVEYHPLIDEVIVFDRPGGAAAVLELRRILKKRHFDITLDLQRHFKSGLFSMMSAATCRIGVHPRNAKEFNWIFNIHHVPFFSDQKPKIDHYHSYIRYLGSNLPFSPDFGLSGLNRADLPHQFAGELPDRYLVVVMGSSWVTKDWTYEGYRNLIDRLLSAKQHGVVLVGDRTQVETADRLAKTAQSDQVLNLASHTSLLELAAILKGAIVSIGPDSGPGHLAAAVGTPYVALFGPTDPRRVAPFGCDEFVVQANSECIGCYRKTCRFKGPNCMEEITPDMVMPKIEMAMHAGRLF